MWQIIKNILTIIGAIDVICLLLIFIGIFISRINDKIKEHKCKK